MDRRDFLKKSAVIAAAAATPTIADAAKRTEKAMDVIGEEGTAGKLITTAPFLQNYAETSMGVAFGVSAMANGYVLLSEHADLRDSVKVKCGGYRVTDMNDEVMLIRLTGLKPATRYYYRIGADRIHYGGGYDMKIIGNEEDPTTYSFTTAGKAALGHFCVINDTHDIWKPFELVQKKVLELAPSCVIWNGDTCDRHETIASIKQTILDPPIESKGFASNIPYMFNCGNHDSRGLANRHFEKVWMFRQPEERSSEDWDLGRNFAVRMGDIALIGLDTAEDKLDENPLFAGLFTSDSYRKAQAVWLKKVLRRKDISSAPFLVACCHIPIFCSNPKKNPGDLTKEEEVAGNYAGYAQWQRTCGKLWGPLLEAAGCQVVIAAHSHTYRYDAPTKERLWAQIVGGGPEMTETEFPTVIQGSVITKGSSKRLVITVHDVMRGKVHETFEYKPR